MKNYFLSASMTVLALAGFGQAKSQPVAADFDKLNWLEGTWTRTNSKPGRSGLEQWTKISGLQWQGKGITMQGKDTAFVEKLQLITKDGSIYYVADVPENKTLVYFKFTKISAVHFVCENPQHDFPKQIVYRKTGTKLTATISGNGKSIEYVFQRK